MKISIIGAGNMGTGLAQFWVQRGHEVMLSYARDQQKLKEAAARVGASAGTPAEAAQFGEVVVLAVPYGQVADALQAAGSLDGKILFSIVNALKPDFSGMAVGTTTSAAEEIARLAPGARVVEALPVFAEVLHSPSRRFGADLATVFYCGDDAEAKQVVAGLLKEIEVEPVDGGPLTNARYVEPAMMFLVQLAYAQGMGGQIAFKLLTR